MIYVLAPYPCPTKLCRRYIDVYSTEALQRSGLSKVWNTVPQLTTKYEPRHDKTNKMSVRPAKTQICLGICTVWSESSLFAQCVAKDPRFLHADSKDSDQTERMPRLIWVFAGRTVTLLVLKCRGHMPVDLLYIVRYMTDEGCASEKYICLVSLVLCTRCLRYFWKTGSASHNF